MIEIRDLTKIYQPVSYTHLDVYKRQHQHLRQVLPVLRTGSHVAAGPDFCRRICTEFFRAFLCDPRAENPFFIPHQHSPAGTGAHSRSSRSVLSCTYGAGQNRKVCAAVAQRLIGRCV